MVALAFAVVEPMAAVEAAFALVPVEAAVVAEPVARVPVTALAPGAVVALVVAPPLVAGVLVALLPPQAARIAVAALLAMLMRKPRRLTTGERYFVVCMKGPSCITI